MSSKLSGCFSKEENIKMWKAFLQRYSFKAGILIAESKLEEAALLNFLHRYNWNIYSMVSAVINDMKPGVRH